MPFLCALLRYAMARKGANTLKVASDHNGAYIVGFGAQRYAFTLAGTFEGLLDENPGRGCPRTLRYFADVDLQGRAVAERLADAIAPAEVGLFHA